MSQALLPALGNSLPSEEEGRKSNPKGLDFSLAENQAAPLLPIRKSGFKPFTCCRRSCCLFKRHHFSQDGKVTCSPCGPYPDSPATLHLGTTRESERVRDPFSKILFCGEVPGAGGLQAEGAHRICSLAPWKTLTPGSPPSTLLTLHFLSGSQALNPGSKYEVNFVETPDNGFLFPRQKKRRKLEKC